MKKPFLFLIALLGLLRTADAQNSSVGPGAVPCAFTTCTVNGVIITGQANAALLTGSGYSLTGSNATSAASLSGTLNTSGVVDVVKVSVTNTASGAGSTLLNLYGGASGVTSEFKVDLTGNVTAAGGVNGASSVGVNSNSTSVGLFLRFGSTIVTSPVNGTWQFGGADGASPAAQTLRAQNVLAGTSNAAGVNTTVIGSLSTGSGTSGDWIFQTGGTGAAAAVQNAAVTAMTIKGVTQNVQFAAQIVAANMTQSAAAQSGTVCWAAAGITYDASLGCLTSLEELKNIRPGGMPEALGEILKLRPFWFSWKHITPEWRGGNHETIPGLGAHATETVDKRLVGYGAKGELQGVHYPEMAALLVAGMQQQEAEIKALRAANDNLAHKVSHLEQRK